MSAQTDILILPFNSVQEKNSPWPEQQKNDYKTETQQIDMLRYVIAVFYYEYNYHYCYPTTTITTTTTINTTITTTGFCINDHFLTSPK